MRGTDTGPAPNGARSGAGALGSSGRPATGRHPGRVRVGERGGQGALQAGDRVGAERVTEAMKEWLVETGRAVEDADIQYLEVRAWAPGQ